MEGSPYRERTRLLMCPRCRELLDVAVDGVRTCMRCEGLWLSPTTFTVAFGNPRGPVGTSAWWRNAIECPECAAEGRTTMLSARMCGDVLVDTCQEHGLWLDRGELAQLLGTATDELGRLRAQGLPVPDLAELRERRDKWRQDGELRKRTTAEYQRLVEEEHRRREAIQEQERLDAAERARQEAETTRVREQERAEQELEAAQKRQAVRERRRLADEKGAHEEEAVAWMQRAARSLERADADQSPARAERAGADWGAPSVERDRADAHEREAQPEPSILVEPAPAVSRAQEAPRADAGASRRELLLARERQAADRELREAEERARADAARRRAAAKAEEEASDERERVAAWNRERRGATERERRESEVRLQIGAREAEELARVRADSVNALLAVIAEHERSVAAAQHRLSYLEGEEARLRKQVTELTEAIEIAKAEVAALRQNT